MPPRNDAICYIYVMGKCMNRKPQNVNEVRLNKAIAMSGLVSRRKADELIRHGKVKVNNKVVVDFNTKVSHLDKLEVQGKSLKAKKHQYLLFYKPKDCITTMKDELSRKTIYEYLPEEFSYLKPVGRLDRDSEGLLLLTNDGDFINQVLHPKNNIKKTYLVTIEDVLSKNEIVSTIDRLTSGVTVDDRILRVDSIEQMFLEQGQKVKQTVFEVVIHEGINRQIRRMFQVLGYSVKKLKRIKIGTFSIKNLQRGKFVELDKKTAYAIIQPENTNRSAKS